MKPVLVDTGFIVARLDASDQHHERCLRVGPLDGPLITCEPVIAESCHLLARLPGANEDVLENVRRGILQIPFALAERAAEVKALLKKYVDVPMDLADACLVDLATQVGTGRILTLDGDFRIYRWGRKRAFELMIEL
jgi:predicted nucleic acid-binding protein